MKNFSIVALVVTLICTAIPVFAQDAIIPKCNEFRIVLQHKAFAVKLTFKGVMSIIADKEGLQRCPTSAETIKKMTEIHSDYVVVEYEELGS